MAECFHSEIKLEQKKVGVKIKVNVDISTDFVDIYIGSDHIRWDRKTGKVIQ